MREYHIYMQRTKRVEWHCDYNIYKWLPWEYVGYVEGTKELYTYFKSKFPYSINSIDFYNSFNYFDDEYFRRDNDCWNSMFNYCREHHRYLIIDDHGNVRDFRQLTKKYKKKTIIHYGTRGGGWSSHCTNLTSDQRKSITPEEIVEVRNEYGITLKPIKPKRKIDFWDYEKESKVSGWKMQSKRRKQWKAMEGI